LGRTTARDLDSQFANRSSITFNAHQNACIISLLAEWQRNPF
jgi:hypothetical protein